MASVVAAAMAMALVAPDPLVAQQRYRGALEQAAGEAAGEAGRTVSVWDGVFTVEQALRGRALYPGPCGSCHGRELDGAPDDPDMLPSPPLARAKFLRDWDGVSLATLFAYTIGTMPENNPGFLSEEEYVDIVAYMLSVSSLPAGGDALRADPESLARILIRQQPR